MILFLIFKIKFCYEFFKKFLENLSIKEVFLYLSCIEIITYIIRSDHDRNSYVHSSCSSSSHLCVRFE